jgi:hypothetical protein
MAHLVQQPPPATGGGSRVADGHHFAEVTIRWVPSHDLTPAQERRRIERAERMRLAIEEMLMSPADEEAHVE